MSPSSVRLVPTKADSFVGFPSVVWINTPPPEGTQVPFASVLTKQREPLRQVLLHGSNVSCEARGSSAALLPVRHENESSAINDGIIVHLTDATFISGPLLVDNNPTGSLSLTTKLRKQ